MKKKNASKLQISPRLLKSTKSLSATVPIIKPKNLFKKGIKKTPATRNFKACLLKIKNYTENDLNSDVSRNLLISLQGCCAAKMKIVTELGFRKNLQEINLTSNAGCIVNALKELFVKIYKNVQERQSIKNDEKHMELEKEWFSSIGAICKELVGYAVESKKGESETTLLNILKQRSKELSGSSMREWVSVFHAIAYETFDAIMKQVTQVDSTTYEPTRTAIDQNNNSLKFTDGDQKLRLTLVAGGCLGQIVNGTAENKIVSFIKSITMGKEEKKELEESLKDRDEGGMYFPRKQLNPFLLTFERELSKVATKETMKTYGSNAVKFICSHMKNATVLKAEFHKAIEQIELEDCCLFELEVEDAFFKIFIRKLVHSRVGAFMTSYNQLKADSQKSLSKGGSMLRDDLYAIALNKKKM